MLVIPEARLMNTSIASFNTFTLSQLRQSSPTTANFFFHSFATKHQKLSAAKCKRRRTRPLFYPSPRIFSSLEHHRSLECSDGKEKLVPEACGGSNPLFQRFGKPMACVLFCIAINLLPIRRIQAPAIAAPVATQLNLDEREEKEVLLSPEGNPYHGYTERLLETVSVVLTCIEDIRRGHGSLKELDAALKKVKATKTELQDEIMDSLRRESEELRREKDALIKKSDRIEDEAMWVTNKYTEMSVKGEGKKAEKLEKNLGILEVEYQKMWESLGYLEDNFKRKQTTAMTTGIGEISFIARECEELVSKCKRDMRRRSTSESLPAGPIATLSKDDIRKDLESAQRKYMEQMLLPRVMDIEGFEPLLDQDLVDFALRIKRGIQEGRELQRHVEAQIRENMKKFGNEKQFVVNTPTDEVGEGFPEIELKWMVGDKEVVVPKAISLQLYRGWRKWLEEAKTDLKKNLLEDMEFGKHYVAQRQERILLDRDRLVSKTWYNEEKNRWEIDPVAVPYAVSNNLVDSARIRHDWGVMYLTLKGDAEEYYFDIKDFDVLFEDLGGFNGLYMKMLACGVPTAVQFMWIPLSELDFYQQILLTMRFSHLCLIGLWKSRAVSYARELIVKNVRNLNEDLLVVIFFPIVNFLIPYMVKMKLGMAWPEGVDWYQTWQSKVDKSFTSRKGNGNSIIWFLGFIIRTTIYGYVLLHLSNLLKKRVPRLLGFGPALRTPNIWKLRRVRSYFKFKKRKMRGSKKVDKDPIRTAFDGMKRVKNPPIPLKEFASIESMRDEINEVVAFLQNPQAFQEMGARAPRGVLIVGDAGTGKTSLAMAIAADAKVPVVQVEPQQLEGGSWVGQGASNVRELFQTARDLAPVIIFVEDFDKFAGVRGKFVHTKKQDHEAFINQLLVELDGFGKQDGVVLMATTANIDQIDAALRRPGRMDRVFHLKKPTQMEREKILQNAAKETMDGDLIDFVDWRKVAEKTSLLLPIELKTVPLALESSAFQSKFVDPDELLGYCSWFATFSNVVPKWIRKTKFAKKVSRMLLDHLGLTLTKEDIQSVVDLMEPYGLITNGLELLDPPLEWTRETKFPYAVWAAGRGLIALLLPNYDVVHNLWLEPSSWKGNGFTKITKAQTEDPRCGNAISRSYLEKKLVFCFGSYVAAQLLLPFGEENMLSSRELMEAEEIAIRMVIQYGWGPDDSPAIYHSNNAVIPMPMGENHELTMAAKAEKIYDLAFCKAKQMLKTNRQALEKIVEELLEFEVLTGKDLERILEAKGGIREQEPFSLTEDSDRPPVSSSFLEGGNASGTVLLGAPSS